MSTLNARELKAAAKDALESSSYHPKKLVLIHTGISLVLSLLLTFVDYLLSKQIGNTGGLSGMDLRTILTTVQSFLQVAQAVLLPFWSAGFLFAAMGILRRSDVSAHSLLEGFRRFGPLLRLQIMQGVIYFFLSMGSIYLSSFVFMATPWAAPLMEALEPLIADQTLLSDPEALSNAMTVAMSGALEQIALPLILITVAVVLIAFVPVFYRFRLAQYLILDDHRFSAMAALAASNVLMKGNYVNFIKLDLSFWWYYLLDALITVICYGDLLLPLLGIQFPWSSTVSFFLFFIAYLVCQLGLHWWKKSDVEVTYAAAFDAAKETGFSKIAFKQNRNV